MKLNGKSKIFSQARESFCYSLDGNSGGPVYCAIPWKNNEIYNVGIMTSGYGDLKKIGGWSRNSHKNAPGFEKGENFNVVTIFSGENKSMIEDLTGINID